jgi:hypothetical protein
MRIWLAGLLALGMAAAQPAHKAAENSPLPDAGQTRGELGDLLRRYPPSVGRVLAIDSSLLGNQPFLEPYPELKAFVETHPEIARNPSFYLADQEDHRRNDPTAEMWRNTMQDLTGFLAAGMAIGMVVWLIRTLVDYKRWSRLARVQTEAHTKLLDRFTANEDLLRYVQSPAGAKFLESAPIPLDAGPRSVSAPMGRILWSVQGGVVLIAGGIGFAVISTRSPESAQPLMALGTLAIALGLGFVASAAISFVLSRRMGLIELPAGATRGETIGG